MSTDKNIQEKSRLHIRNKNRELYDLNNLISVEPSLSKFITINKFGTETIDFSNAEAVRLLNKALLNHYYGIKFWEFPSENLCPPIPGRADYLHYIADLLAQNNYGKIPYGSKIKGLDIGIGANCIYPIIGVTEYDWNFVGTDISQNSINAAKNIVEKNPELKDRIEIRIQPDSRYIFKDIFASEEKFDFTLCNPPFHASEEEGKTGTKRKIKNLTGNNPQKTELNFAGIDNELICEGGEAIFIYNMARESRFKARNCFWFTTLVSKESNLKRIQKVLKDLKVEQLKIIPMGTGNKTTRIVAWSFLNKEEQKIWRESRWKQ